MCPIQAPKGARSVRLLSLVLGAGAVLALSAGCSQPAPNVTVQAPTVGGTGPGADGITVTGVGEVSGAPDTLTISFGVQLERDSVQTAVADNATVATKVQEAVKAGGIDAKDIRTQNYRLSPSFDFVEGKQVPRGFQVNNSVVVKVHDLAGAGALIDEVTKVGGDAVTVQGVSFTLEDNKTLLANARDEAYQDAKAKADQFAALSGRGIATVESISESANAMPRGMLAESQTDYAVAGSAPTPVNPGEVTTSLQVVVRYSFR